MNNKSLEQKIDQTIGFIIGFGCGASTMLSFSINHSIPIAVIHGICSWLYVVYYSIDMMSK